MTNKAYASGTVIDSGSLNDFNTATYNLLTAVAGTNTITATGPLSFSAYAGGKDFEFVPAVTNTGAVTININGLGARAITKYGTTPLVAGDLVAGAVVRIIDDGTRFQLLNPQVTDIAHGGTGSTTASGARTNLGATAIGSTIFTAADAAAVRTAINVAQIGPTFRATRLTTDQTISSGVFTEAILNNEVFDTDNAYNPATGRFTPQVAGYYQINVTARLQTSSGTITNGQANLYKNGAVYSPLVAQLSYPSSIFVASGSTTVFLNGTTDYVSLFCFMMVSAGTPSIGIASEMSGTFMRP